MTEIRALTIGDLSQVHTLTDASVREGFRFVQRFLDDMPNMELNSPTQYFLGVFDDNQLRAIGGVTPDPYTDDPHVGRIRRVYVLPGFRRHGYASHLLAALEARAHSIYSTLRLQTDTDAAASFYESRGYVRSTEPDVTHVRVWPSGQ
ncbi:MAG: GNAT family N-acetyltransferase [Gemmatimonadaceae bacterium]